MWSTLSVTISLNFGVAQNLDIVGRQLVTGFDIDLARLRVDHVERAVAADELLVGHGDGFTPSSCHLRSARTVIFWLSSIRTSPVLRIRPIVVGLRIAHPRADRRASSTSRPWRP